MLDIRLFDEDRPQHNHKNIRLRIKLTSGY